MIIEMFIALYIFDEQCGDVFEILEILCFEYNYLST